MITTEIHLTGMQKSLLISSIKYSQRDVSQKLSKYGNPDSWEKDSHKGEAIDSLQSKLTQYQKLLFMLGCYPRLSVYKFTYDGFEGTLDKTKFHSFDASFIKWTADPGVAEFQCTDGEIRILPIFAVEDFKTRSYPRQKKTGVVFGQPIKI